MPGRSQRWVCDPGAPGRELVIRSLFSSDCHRGGTVSRVLYGGKRITIPGGWSQGIQYPSGRTRSWFTFRGLSERLGVARPRNQAKRRRDIISAAQRAIATRGLGALRLKDVAEEAGVTGPAVSYYYPDLDELLVDVYERQIESYISRAPSVVVGLTHPWDQLEAAMAQDLPEGPNHVDAIIMYQFSGEPRFSRTYRTMSSALHSCQMGIYRSIIDSGITRGVFSPTLSPESLAGVVIALADAYGLQVVVAEPNMTKRTAHHEMCKVVADLLRFSIDDHQSKAAEGPVTAKG